jgi:uncharacterized protein YegP (UPF0339 family)
MPARVERVLQDTNPVEISWHLKDRNGEIICQGESHRSPENVQRAVNNVAREFAILYLNALSESYPEASTVQDIFELADSADIDIEVEDA